MSKKLTVWYGVFGVFLSCAFFSPGSIRYFGHQVIKGPPAKVIPYPEAFSDSTESDTLYETLSAAGIPLYYHRNIRTSVCFDGKCRLLVVSLYWNPTGTYLGFELPKGEFLSKTDHDPFSEREYEKLQAILSDSLSPLADYSFEELVSGSNDSVDAVSSATLKEITDYIVPGAAYTTYRLWHLLYEKSQETISGYSTLHFSEQMAREILESGQVGDRIWALNRLHLLSPWSEALTVQVLALLDSGNLNLAERAIAAIGPGQLEKMMVQQRLSEVFESGEYGLKKLVLNKLRESRQLQNEIAGRLARLLPSLNGDLLSTVLELFWEKKVTDPECMRQVAALLDSPNRFVRTKGYAFLQKVQPQIPSVQEKMTRYSKQPDS